MTREEAIEYLNTLYMALAVFPNQQISLENVNEMKESVSMAIKALEQNESAEEWYKLFVEKLEQKPCNDAISREEVLRMLKACLTGGEIEYQYVKLHIDSIPSVNLQESKDTVSREDANKLLDLISFLMEIIKKLQSNKQDSMRNATSEEQKSVDDYIKNISKPTGVDFGDLEQEPCDDAISRQALLEEIENGIKAGNYEEGYEKYSHINDMDDIIECIKYADSIQPKPKTGHWKRIGYDIYECSICGQNVMTSDICEYRHCHGCGAKMESEG